MADVELRGVGKVFANGVEAVGATDLAVKDGEFLAVLGPSGSGKSTLLRLVAGLEEATSGEVRIGGRDVTRRAPRERDVAMVFQHPALFPHLSVFDNLAFGLRARGAGRGEVRERVDWAAGLLRLGDVLGRRPATLSGGQRQRVALGRAMVRRPAVFLFDEPLSGLDGPLRASVRDDLIGLHRRLGATMIYVTHDQGEALALGDRVGVMERGRVVQVGPPREVYDRPVSRFVAGFVGSPPMGFVPCEVLDGGAGPVRVRPSGLGDGVSFPAPAGPVAERRGGRVVLGLRPEHVALAREGDGLDPAFTWLPVPVEVHHLEFLGHETIAALGPAEAPVHARLPASTRARPGDRFRLGVDLAGASWFEPETGAALPADGG